MTRVQIAEKTMQWNTLGVNLMEKEVVCSLDGMKLNTRTSTMRIGHTL